METLGVIPARLASTRLKGKVLLNIAGKPMVRHVWERAAKAKLLDGLLVACDDKKVFKACGEFGAEAVMTSKACASGTDRIAEAAGPRDVKIVVNIQGDEPLVHPSM